MFEDDYRYEDEEFESEDYEYMDDGEEEDENALWDDDAADGLLFGRCGYYEHAVS